MPTHLLWPVLTLLLLPGLISAQTLPFGISLPPSLNFATSPTPVGSGARAAGWGFAFIAVADDATAASWNPGALIQLERPEASIVGSYFIRVEKQDVTQPDVVLDNQTLDRFDLNYLSVAYPFRLFKRNVVVSLNYQRLFDLKSTTDVVSTFSTIDGVQEVHSDQNGGLFTISPAIAVQITPTLSIGVAVNFWPNIFGNGWKQEVSVEGTGRVASGNRTVPFISEGEIDEEFDFQGLNVTVGAYWIINHIFTLGGVLRSPFSAKLTHKHSSSITVTLLDGSDSVTSSDSFTEKLDMDMPLSYGFGLAARLSDNLSLAATLTRVHWSDFKLEASSQDSLLVENGAPAGRGTAVLNGGADDTTTVRIGGEYLLIGQHYVVPFRVGFFYDQEPADGSPDDFFGFTLGTGLAYGKFIVDVAYIFRTGTVTAEATDTTVYQNRVVASVIYHF